MVWGEWMVGSSVPPTLLTSRLFWAHWALSHNMTKVTTIETLTRPALPQTLLQCQFSSDEKRVSTEVVCSEPEILKLEEWERES